MPAVNALKNRKYPQKYPLANQPKKYYESPVTAYGDIISLPSTVVKGQISVTAKGLTATNIINNGNFANGTSGWQGTNATISVSNNTMQVVPDGSAIIGWLLQNTSYSIFPSGKYFIKAKLRVTNNDCVGMRAMIRSTGGSGDSTYKITTPVANQWYSLTIILDSQATNAGNFRLLFAHEYADAATANGKIMEVQEVMAIDLTAHGLENKTYEELNQMFPHWFDGTKSTISAMRLKSVSADETETSTAYVVAKDEEGNIAELRSLPNGVKDEISIGAGGAIKTQRVSNTYIVKESDVTHLLLDSYEDYDIVRFDNINESWVPFITSQGALVLLVDNRSITKYNSSILWCWYIAGTTPKTFRVVVPKGFFTDLNAAKSYFAGATLTYQLAEPIITAYPRQELVCYPNGTIYIEPVVSMQFDEYNNGIAVDDASVPIQEMDYCYKLDTDTGEYIDVLESVSVAVDGLSFSIDGAVNGEFYEYGYWYDRALSILPITEYRTPLGLTLPVPLGEMSDIYQPTVLGTVHRLGVG